MEEKDKWRPSKFDNFLIAFEKVVENEINAIILTDEELFIKTNELLKWEDKICYTTFKNYKSEAIKGIEEERFYNGFLSVYKKALLNQKSSLFSKLQSDPQSWQRFAWIIERKFSEWNLRHIWEVKTTNEITITEEEKKNKIEALKDFKK